MESNHRIRPYLAPDTHISGMLISVIRDIIIAVQSIKYVRLLILNHLAFVAMWFSPYVVRAQAQDVAKAPLNHMRVIRLQDHVYIHYNQLFPEYSGRVQNTVYLH